MTDRTDGEFRRTYFHTDFLAQLGGVEVGPKAQALGMIRVIDESGESYLYSSEMFAPIAIQNALEGQLLAA